MVIVSGKFAREHKLTPLFKIRGFGDAARDPVEFTVAPSDAVPRAFKHAGVAPGDVQFHEINEAFSVVPLINARYVVPRMLTFWLRFLLLFGLYWEIMSQS